MRRRRSSSWSGASSAFAADTASMWRTARLSQATLARDQRRIRAHHLAPGDAGGGAGLHRALGDPVEPRGMVRNTVMEAVAGEPADREVHPHLAHQSAVVHDPEQEAREHQPKCRLGIHSRAADIRRRRVRRPHHSANRDRERDRRAQGRGHPEQVPQRATDEELKAACAPSNRASELSRRTPLPNGIRKRRRFQQPPRSLAPERSGPCAEEAAHGGGRDAEHDLRVSRPRPRPSGRSSPTRSTRSSPSSAP